MNQTYNDPVKEKARQKQKDFIARNLTSFKDPRQVRVVCFPGAEVEGEAGLEITSIYDPLRIPRSNITGIEADPRKAQRLRESNLGIRVHEGYDLDFFKQAEEQYDIISLDYTGNRDRSKRKSLIEIAGNQLLYRNGILCTNHSGYRESRESQELLMSATLQRLIGEGFSPEEIQQIIDRQESEEKLLDLSAMRESYIDAILAFFRMGKSLRKPNKILEMHPRGKQIHGNFSRDFYKMFPPGSEELEEVFSRGDWEPETFDVRLLVAYKEVQQKALLEYIMNANRLIPHTANLFLNSIYHTQNGALFAREIESYGYTSNKKTPMELDLISFRSSETIYGPFQNNLFYNPKNGRMRFTRRISSKKIQEVSDADWEVHKTKIPERVHLGSSWKPKPKKKSPQLEEITRAQAVDLLQSGIPTTEIAETFSGFSKMQLAALKAHYVTMGKEFKE